MGLLSALGLQMPRKLPGADDAAGLPPPPGGEMPPPPEGGDKAKDAKKAEAAAEKAMDRMVKSIDAELKKAKTAIGKLKMPALQQNLEAEHTRIQSAREVAWALKPEYGVPRLTELEADAKALAIKADIGGKHAGRGEKELADRVETPLKALELKFKALDAKGQGIYEPRLKQIREGAKASRELLETGEFAQMPKKLVEVQQQIRTLDGAIAQHATEFPKYRAQRKKVTDMLGRIAGGGMLDADGLKAINDLKTAVEVADTVGPIRGWASAQQALNQVIADGVKLRANNAAYKDYTAERAKVEKEIEALRAHKQGAKLSNECDRLDKQIAAANLLASDPKGGALKALTALKAVRADCAAVKALAGKLDAAEKKLPALTKKLETGGIPKEKVAETAQMALKLLVEEECSEDDAVKMAKDASDFRAEKMDEHDAMMSSRVKSSLEKSGLAPEHAKSIGRNVRASGSASAEDAKALAQAMKGVSKGAIDALNASDIHSECCRGPITDAMPGLAGVQPRGWPEESTWDQVVGVYSPSSKSLVVGTIADKDGKRKVPEAGEGPNPHGSSDLFGHEAGHAFDDAKPGGKSGNTAFIKARDEDVANGDMAGSAAGGVDDYFMRETEGGANTAGATSETFAESFAMHFGSTPKRWPKLEAFWASNPWGV
jgi:cell division protein FtsB